MKPIVLAYRSDWNEAELPPERVNYKPLTHIAHSFAVVGATGIKSPATDSARKLVETAHRNGVKVLLAVGGAESNAALSTLCATKAGARTLAQSVAARVLSIGYDGADIDWESPENHTEGNRLSHFVAEMRLALPRPKLVTMAVTAVDWFGRWFDSPALEPHVDWAAVMCYDFYGPWSDRAGYHSALYPSKKAPPKADEQGMTASGGIHYWRERKRFPADKLLLGIPLYARGFRTKEWGAVVPNAADRKFEVTIRSLKDGGTTDPDAVCATWQSENGSVLLAGDNTHTARLKGAWARQNKLGGVFFWELSQDGDGKSAPSVIRAARDGWGE